MNRRALGGSRRLPSADRGGPDPNPVRVLHSGGPWVQATAGQPLDVGFGLYYLRAAGHYHAPPGLGLLVVVVGLVRGQILFVGRSLLRFVGRSELPLVS